MKMSISKEDIAKFDFDREGIVNRILNDDNDRDLVVKWITTDKNIMVYYQCFYIIQDATKSEPKLFIKYWDDFVNLINHKNSYHRDIGYTIISNIIRADSKKRFSKICDEYLKGIYDCKFKTAVSCISNLKRIVEVRNDMADFVFDNLIDHDKKTVFPQKQEEYIFGEISKVFDAMLELLGLEKRNKAINFIYNNAKSKSPKTRKICKEIIKRRNITIAST